MRLSKIKSILILSGAILLVGLGVVLPTLLSIRTIRTDISSTQLLMEHRYQQRQVLSSLTTNLQAIRGTAGSLSGYAIREGEELRFIKSLEDIASAQDVAQDIRLETANQKDLSAWEKVVPLSITVQGRYRDVLQYIRSTESLPYLLQFDALSFHEIPPGAGSEPGAVEARIIGRVHWLANASPEFVWGK